jgi:hypothetical protein
MPQHETAAGAGATYRECVLDVRIVEFHPPGADGARYRLDAPRHRGITFEDSDTAELYADIYFDVNGVEEDGTGDRGVPPVTIQAGRDTLAAYLLTMPYADSRSVGSFFGIRPGEVERYASRVRDRATNIRRRVRQRGHD